MSDTPNVIIFFVGLALWTAPPVDVNSVGTAQRRIVGTDPTVVVRSEPKVHVILPYVHYTWNPSNSNQTNRMSASAHTNHAMSNAQIADKDGNTAHVEDHVAVLITYTDSFVMDQSSGWPSPTQIGTSEFSYVSLNADSLSVDPKPHPSPHLQFVTTGDTSSNPPLSTMTPLLPRLTGVTTLDPDFAYPRAAAVFDLPVGTMESCLSMTRIGKPRLDTSLALSTTRDLIVSSGDNRLHIKRSSKPDADPRIVLLVANIPKRYLDGNYAEHSSNPLEQVSHVNAYYALTTASCGSCAQNLKDWFDLHMEELGPCKTDLTNLAGKNICPYVNAENTLAGIVQGANYMCSSEGWP
jgi:hypothetical protein